MSFFNIPKMKELKANYYNDKIIYEEQASKLLEQLKDALKKGFIGIYLEDEIVFNQTLNMFREKGYIVEMDDFRNITYTYISIENEPESKNMIKATLKNIL